MIILLFSLTGAHPYGKPESEETIFLPMFGNKTKDEVAIKLAKELFEEREDKPKKVVPVNINEIAEDGGVLNCISWEQLNPNNTHNAWNRRLSFAQAYLSG